MVALIVKGCFMPSFFLGAFNFGDKEGRIHTAEDARSTLLLNILSPIFRRAWLFLRLPLYCRSTEGESRSTLPLAYFSEWTRNY
ncbi:hypothetical protein BDN70DRAFT_489713 [Pholiota conissans]|uniref:Uncharacterized protein n=1 Tax=Pholiota conissans TaxID=109636 RepID=A0A9P5YNQ3_9AGAR|nr:hypothetical protein BDN70DRAFT_489713 [Pholiota conissans]